MKKRIQAAATSLWVIVSVTLLLRLGYLVHYTREHAKQAVSVIPFLFESGNIAYSLAMGHGFSSPFHIETGPTAWLPPVYPFLLAEVFRLFGAFTFHTYVAAALLNVCFVTLACVPIYFIGKRIGGVGVAAGAAWLWVVFPNAILLPIQSMWDACLSALLAATILWATLEIAESERLRDWCSYGLLWGVTLMTNATLIALLPLLLGWLAYRAHETQRAWIGRISLSAGIVAVCCVPWTIRNYQVFHRFIPLRSILGLQLWLGNNDQTKDIFRGDLHPIYNPDERAKYIQMGEIAYMQAKQHEAIQYILTHPEREAHLAGNRFISIWSGGTPNPVADFLHVSSGWFRFVLLFNIAVAVGTLLGIGALFRWRSVYAFPVALFPLVIPWAYYLTLALPRYRLPIDPMVMLLTAVALKTLFVKAISTVNGG